MAGTTGLEPATSGVTGRRSNQLNYVPALAEQLQNTMPPAPCQIRPKKTRAALPDRLLGFAPLSSSRGFSLLE